MREQRKTGSRPGYVASQDQIRPNTSNVGTLQGEFAGDVHIGASPSVVRRPTNPSASALRQPDASVAQFRARIARASHREKPGLVLLGPEASTSALSAALATGHFGHWKIVESLRDDLADDIAKLRDLVRRRAVDTVVLAMPTGSANRIRRLCEDLVDLPVGLYLGIDPDVVGTFARTIRRIDRLPFPELLPPPHGLWRRAAKRLFDLAFVIAALPVVAPVLAISAIAIRIESRGPILFSQWRFGRGNKPVLIWKFRTMFADRGDPTGEKRTLARDPRVTKVGRFLRRSSIDELPQLFNILRGEMSVVGPRPHAMQMRVNGIYYFDAVAGYGFRHRVKPGLTGWAQINGWRGEVDTLEKAHRRVEMDLWYIARWSVTLDAWIVLRTVFGGFASPGAD